MANYADLKQKHRDLRDGFPMDLTLRIHRSLSWLDCAERAGDDSDAAFIFLWISFNAAYAREIGDAPAGDERSVFDGFFQELLRLDSDERIYGAIWQRFSSPIRLFIDNKYIFQPFWKYHNRIAGSEDWEERFERSKRAFNRGFEEKNTRKVLSMLFDRLYVLRNQLVHGGATWNGALNRDQVRDGAHILGFLIPIFIDLMMDSPEIDWGQPYYPIVDP